MTADSTRRTSWKTQEGMSPIDQANARKSCMAPNHYELSADSKVREGVPKGAIHKFQWASQKNYPGTARENWLYMPQQYDGSQPANLKFFRLHCSA